MRHPAWPSRIRCRRAHPARRHTSFRPLARDGRPAAASSEAPASRGTRRESGSAACRSIPSNLLSQHVSARAIEHLRAVQDRLITVIRACRRVERSSYSYPASRNRSVRDSRGQPTGDLPRASFGQRDSSSISRLSRSCRTGQPSVGVSPLRAITFIGNKSRRRASVSNEQVKGGIHDVWLDPLEPR